MPALVVAIALKPSAARTIALPASQALGMMNPGFVSCRARKARAAARRRGSGIRSLSFDF